MKILLKILAWTVRLLGVAIVATFFTSVVFLTALMLYSAISDLSAVEVASGIALIVGGCVALLVGGLLVVALFGWAHDSTNRQ